MGEEIDTTFDLSVYPAEFIRSGWGQMIAIMMQEINNGREKPWTIRGNAMLKKLNPNHYNVLVNDLKSRGFALSITQDDRILLD